MERNELRARIIRQVVRERLTRWHELQAEDKTPKLDLMREEPAPELTPWENLKATTQEDTISGKDMAEYLEQNELGDARLYQRLHMGHYCYDHSRERWLVYGGVVWEDDTLRCAQRAVVDMAERYEAAGKDRYRYFADQKSKLDEEIIGLERKMTALEMDDADADTKRRQKKEIDELKDQSEQLGKKARNAKKSMDERAKGLRATVRSKKILEMSAIGPDSCGRTGKEFDQQPTLLAFANGIVDLETGKMIRPSPHLNLTKISRIAYPGYHAYSAWWDDHLRKVFCGNEMLIEYFENCIGYSATGLQVNKDIWCALGPNANNGKSVTFNTIREVMGDVATTIKLDVLLEDKNRSKGPDPDLMVLDGIRMGVASEAGQNVKFSMERIKAITGGDEVRARGMYADSKILSTKVKLWLHTNDIPQISGFDPGFMLRLRILPFMAQFVGPDEVDESVHKYPALGKQDVDRLLRESKPAIAAWIVRCARKFLQNIDYKTPEIVLHNTKEYFEENDTIGQFIDDACEKHSDCKSGSNELWKAYRSWCVEILGMDSKHVISNKRLSIDLKKRGYQTTRTRPTTIFAGLQPKAEWLDKGNS